MMNSAILINETLAPVQAGLTMNTEIAGGNVPAPRCE